MGGRGRKGRKGRIEKGGPLLLKMHGEVSLDGSLRDERAAHTGECLPYGEDTKSVHFLLWHPSCLFDQLTEHLE